MFFKRKFLLFTLFSIIIFQILLFINNNQKASFRFFKWSEEETSIGKLINISFFSGLFLSTLLNTTVTNLNKNTLESEEEDYEPINYQEDIKTNIEIPPQRDIRDTQPTISVNYRVVKNTEANNLKSDQDYSNSIKKTDDWDDNNDDW